MPGGGCCGAAFRCFKGWGGSSTEAAGFEIILLFFLAAGTLFKGNKEGEERCAMAGGSCSFSWVEDYRSLRRFCVLAARRLGVRSSFVHFAKVRTTVSLHLGKMWAWGTCLRTRFPLPPPRFLLSR